MNIHKILIMLIFLLTSCGSEQESNVYTDSPSKNRPKERSNEFNFNGFDSDAACESQQDCDFVSESFLNPDEESSCEDDSNKDDCYTSNQIVIHGSYLDTPGIYWTSSNIRDILSEGVDSKFHMRVKVFKQPSRNTSDYKSQRCTRQPVDFRYLSLTFRAGSQEWTFNKIPVGGVSKIYKFPNPSSIPNNFILKLTDLKWDFTCKNDPDGRWCNGESSKMTQVPRLNCVKMQLQITTDPRNEMLGEILN